VRQQVYVQLKAATKACSALMLMLFNNQPVPRAVCSIIKLLSRSGYEMQPYSSEVALRCSTAAIAMWRKLSIQALARTLSQLELDEVKVAIFQAFLDQADLLVARQTAAGAENDLVRSAVCGAMEVVQSLPDRLKLSFNDRVVQLGSALVTAGSMSDAIYLLQITVNNIDVLLRAVGTVRPANRSADGDSLEDGALSSKDVDDLYNLKIRALLSVAFAYKEMK
jgi:hypothetical protein